MPKLSLNIKILQNGISHNHNKSTDENAPELCHPLRDHYHRFEAFSRKQYPERESQFVIKLVAQKAASSDRDTTIGILDTVAREFITYWMPKVELLFATDARNEAGKSSTTINKLAACLERDVLDIAIRIGCSDPDTRTLRDSLVQQVRYYLRILSSRCETESNEKVSTEDISAEFTKQIRSTAKARSKKEVNVALEVLPEAHILDSTIAWRLADSRERSTRPISPTSRQRCKRRFSQINTSEEPDPADNGQAWLIEANSAKRQRFKFSIPKALAVSGLNVHRHYDTSSAPGKHAKAQTIDLTTDDGTDLRSGNEDELVHEKNKRALHIPGSFS